jgi:predicted nucleic acid-binding protein
LIYIDTSALLKLVRDGAESAALREYLEADTPPALVSSALLTVEARRGTMRSNPARMPRVDVLLATVTQVEISAAVVESAGRLPDPMLRSLDAIHLATALLVREELEVLLSYDDRLLAAADAHGIPTAAPA